MALTPASTRREQADDAQQPDDALAKISEQRDAIANAFVQKHNTNALDARINQVARSGGYAITIKPTPPEAGAWLPNHPAVTAWDLDIQAAGYQVMWDVLTTRWNWVSISWVDA